MSKCIDLEDRVGEASSPSLDVRFVFEALSLDASQAFHEGLSPEFISGVYKPRPNAKPRSCACAPSLLMAWDFPAYLLKTFANIKINSITTVIIETKFQSDSTKTCWNP